MAHQRQFTPSFPHVHRFDRFCRVWKCGDRTNSRRWWSCECSTSTFGRIFLHDSTLPGHERYVMYSLNHSDCSFLGTSWLLRSSHPSQFHFDFVPGRCILINLSVKLLSPPFGVHLIVFASLIDPQISENHSNSWASNRRWQRLIKQPYKLQMELDI